MTPLTSQTSLFSCLDTGFKIVGFGAGDTAQWALGDLLFCFLVGFGFGKNMKSGGQAVGKNLEVELCTFQRYTGNCVLNSLPYRWSFHSSTFWTPCLCSTLPTLQHSKVDLLFIASSET